MPEIIQTIVYRLDELGDTAKDRARAWYRDGQFDHDWYEPVYEDFERICVLLGITLDTRSVRLFGGGTREKPCIYFSGFYCQGDGACFEGRYAYRPKSVAAIRAYAPNDVELHRIALVLACAQRRNFYQLTVAIKHRGRYHHEHTMVIDVERYSPAGQNVAPNSGDDLVEALRDLARWLYRALEAEHDYQTSDASVDEMIAANAYTFTENGLRFG